MSQQKQDITGEQIPVNQGDDTKSNKSGISNNGNQQQQQSQQQQQQQQQQPQQQQQQIQGQQMTLQQKQAYAQQLVADVTALNQQKQQIMAQGQQPQQIDQQIYQKQVQYQYLMQQIQAEQQGRPIQQQQPGQIQQSQYQQQGQFQQQQRFQQQQQPQQQIPGGFGGGSMKQNPNLSEKQQRQIQREQKNAKSAFPRKLIPESNEENMDLGGGYQKCLFYLGECCGSIRAVCPCCFCVKYPFVQVDQGQEGIYQRFGKFVKTVKAGLHQVNPCTDQMIKYSTKQITFDMAKQNCITKDNILVSVDGQLFYRVVEPRYAQYYTNNVQNCVVQLSYTALRTIIGHFILQDILEQKERLRAAVQNFIETHVWDWGVSIDSVMIKEITPTPDVAETLNAAAKERRLAEAKIISAQSDVQSAKLMREAADILDSKAAMQIRYLETVRKLTETSKVIFLGDEDQQ